MSLIDKYLRAGFPAIQIVTNEIHRAEEYLASTNDGWNMIAYDCIRGLRDLKQGELIDDNPDPTQALNTLATQSKTVLIAHNFHMLLNESESKVLLIQTIQNLVPIWKSKGCCLCLLGNTSKLPPEVEPFFHCIDFPLPSSDHLAVIQRDLARDTGVEMNPQSVITAKGLTEFQAETAFALSLVERKAFDSQVVADVKGNMIRKSGLMEFWEPEDPETLGGLGNFKAYIESRKETLMGKNDKPKPKAVILLGIPGTGKSLSCKVVASILQRPLIRLDIAALKNSLVGESERQMREATKVIDAFGTSTVWLDEVEKALSGVKSSGYTDGGTTSGMFGHLLTWMQETESDAFIVATANDISALPPEFLRAGRFDAVFFVELPTRAERKDIIEIMNRRYDSNLPADDTALDATAGFTGAEIEQWAKDSLFEGEGALKQIVPLSKTMEREIKSLREWAKTRARIANAPEEVEQTKGRMVMF
jgi:hypothetical protein